MMRKRSNAARINHNAAWKYILLICVIVIMLFSAIPTLYGENAAVQIGPNSGKVPTPVVLQQKLEAAGIPVKSIIQDPKKTVVVVQKSDQQNEAKALLSTLVQDPDGLTLALEPAAPKWMLNMGFAPIKLGLDLRGGVQFLLDVDVKEVFKTQATQLADDLRHFVRQNNMFGSVVTQNADNSISITLPNSADSSQVRNFLSKNYISWQTKDGSGNNLNVSLSQEEQQKVRLMTVQQNLQTMRTRIEELGITEASVQRQGENQIRIELPGVQNPAAAKHVIGATASLAFYPVVQEGTGSSQIFLNKEGYPVRVARRPVLGGDHIVGASAGMGQNGLPEVNITLDGAGGRLMSDFSRNNVGKPMATVYSQYSRNAQNQMVQTNQVISVATIQSQLGSRFQITGLGSVQKAQQLALLLRAGSLTAPVTIVAESTIGPTLGAENIHNGFAALALGMIITLSFMLIWYRRLGWIAGLALITNMILLFGLLALIPGGVLTLPGIAGLVLTVGMAVDTNVLIFERIRDKLQEGRSLAQSIDRGFSMAVATIFDANFTTLITAFILYSIGNGPIQGFALTLGLGILTSMFSGIFASRVMINSVWGRDSRRDVRI